MSSINSELRLFLLGSGAGSIAAIWFSTSARVTGVFALILAVVLFTYLIERQATR